ncbi:urease accessory protein UreF [Helicobacter mustelae]|uniref:Urease accessory protein UreF n=1 Tax=Helicobacter mustelae (strain ATCC 43772 / CCUG 25715 / CIP 103759 / LMG 18044 / NCTC 12198 / R85-136P) TaxID=679897 RepID=D3UGF0_HELM1|nr:urease accessory protein UreF [Helicobacter mustelae]CBG39571.1 putative urease accessory protein UreF [Helicobacter mustelae 12198]SQH71083.1 urease accessory protein UreF [Helicobacter mustelae]STP12212.1 urease accessory protein UreF [Helicobacter mustelae]
MALHKDFLLLQINDSLFPIGGYTHSFGLESYIQKGVITNKKQALEYLISNLSTQILYTDLLMIKLIFEAGENLDEILELESLVHAATPASEMREGAHKLGMRFIKTTQVMMQESKPFFQEYAKNSKYAVHASAYGVFCMAYKIPLEKAVRHYLYAQASSIVTNCVKTIPLSQSDGQVILTQLHEKFDWICHKLKDLSRDYFCNASVHNDIKAMQHENLYSRLYMS